MEVMFELVESVSEGGGVGWLRNGLPLLGGDHRDRGRWLVEGVLEELFVAFLGERRKFL